MKTTVRRWFALTRTKFETALRGALTAVGLETPTYAVVAPVIWGEDGAEIGPLGTEAS